MDNNNETSNTHRFIFNNDFYNNLENASNNLPPQRDMLAPVTEQVKQPEPANDKSILEQVEEVKVDIPEPKEENEIIIPEMENIEEDNSINIEEINDLIPTVSEPVIVKPEPEVTVEEEVVVEPEPIKEEVTEEPEIIVEEPQEEKTIDTLEVNTGIDKNLENEVLNSMREDKIEEVPIYKPIVEEEPVRTVYRAVRRPNRNNMNGMNYTLNEKPAVSEPTKEVSTIEDEVVPIKHIDKVPQELPQRIDKNWVPPYQPSPIVITEEVNYYEEEQVEVVKSTVLEKLKKEEEKNGSISILARYGDDFCSHDYITNPAIGRSNEIKSLGLILLTPDKSAILVGKPGIGKTSIVEGLAYKLQRNQVPEALKGYTIISIKTASLLGSLPNGETRLQTLVDELKGLDKIILFIDEIHMLMSASDGSNLDFANLFKESLGRGSIKMIGATTSEEYERYVLRDKAFVRRFQRVDVNEPTPDECVEIIMGTIPKIEANTGAKLKYSHYQQVEIMKFIVNITSEYKRVYGLGSRYPDICLTLLTQAFSEAVFDNRNEVNIHDIRNAISKSKNIYPDVIKKELINFDREFRDLLEED